MIGADTNVLLRYLTGDDPEQTEIVRRFLARTGEAGERVHLSHVVLAEAVWVLRSSMRLDRRQITGALRALLAEPLFSIPRRAAVARAVSGYEEGAGDFADYLIAELNAGDGCSTTVTFDGDLEDEPLFHLL